LILIEKVWNLPTSISPDDEHLPLAQRLLFSRGVTCGEEVRAFLSDTHDGWHDPMLFPDMAIACERVLRAVQQNENILIYGDYDADGITSTALLTLFLRKVGANCSYLIPDRVAEGYGMSEMLYSKIHDRNPDLLITVDCGVANIDEVAELNRSGIDVIITDHHEVKPTLPAALAVLNAKRTDSQYPFSQLSGVGVALKFVQALCMTLSPITKPDDWRSYLDLAAIGTIADLVPVLDENRMLVKEGIALLQNRRRMGIRALYASSHQSDPRISATTVSYIFVPRINAAGRMGDASRAVELLITDNESLAAQIAEELSQENTRRQEVELAIFEEAVQILENSDKGKSVVHSNTGPILVRGKDWHPGVIGIVASRLVTRYSRSAIVFTENSGHQGLLKGSARACDGYNILEAILYAQEYTEQFGGHPKAAGISVQEETYELFAEKIREYEIQNGADPYVPSVEIDACLAIDDLTLDTCREIASLSPFGEGNREPRFLVRDCRIARVESCGKGKHLKIRFSMPDSSGREKYFDGIAFGMGHLDELYRANSMVDAVVELSISIWGNRESVSMQIVDMHFQKTGQILDDAPDILEKLYRNSLPLKQIAMLAKGRTEDLLPAKENIKIVYQFLRTRCAEEITLCDIGLLARFVSANYGISLHGFALARILDIFEESGLLCFHSRKGQRVCFTLIFVDGKVKLENTQTFQRLFTNGGNP